jgi:two-component system, OmpR family, phosphate regulon response regulator PhoB
MASHGLAVESSPLLLLVEHESERRELLGLLFRQWRFCVVLAASAPDALRVATTTPPDVITLDLDLPNLDGLRLCRLLRRQHSLASVPIIGITGCSDHRFRQRAYHAGCSPVLTKTCPPERLAASIRRLL